MKLFAFIRKASLDFIDRLEKWLSTNDPTTLHYVVAYLVGCLEAFAECGASFAFLVFVAWLWEMIF